MNTTHTILTLSAVALLAACAVPGQATKADEHAVHLASAAPNAMHERMQQMQAMRDKMMNARTPAERQALMDEHMKAMHEGMDTMKGMGGMGMMGMRMDMMQTVMEMMMQRMPGGATPPTGK